MDEFAALAQRVVLTMDDVRGCLVLSRDGRTASVTMRRTELHEGEHRIIAEEFAVLDRAGRLQLPRAHIEALDLHDRVRLRLEDDHVGVFPYVTHKVDNETNVPAAEAKP